MFYVEGKGHTGSKLGWSEVSITATLDSLYATANIELCQASSTTLGEYPREPKQFLTSRCSGDLSSKTNNMTTL